MKLSHKINKAWSRGKMIVKEFFQKWKDYSFQLAVYSTLWWIGFYVPLFKGLHSWAWKRIQKYLDKYIATLGVEVPDENPANCPKVDSFTIWVFWWQGEENMPELVKMCYNQLYSQNENVVLVTENNYKNYCDIPQEIVCKVQQGRVSPTHLSDLIRVSLLFNHGGMWVDSTCFLSSDVPIDDKNRHFFSPHTDSFNSHWVSWCLGTNMVNNPLFGFIRNVFLLVMEDKPSWPIYLFLDYCINYAYRNSDSVREMINSCPENNLGRNDLHFLLNKPWDSEVYNQVASKNWLFKLSYKTPWSKSTGDGRKTFYGHLIEKMGSKN